MLSDLADCKNRLKQQMDNLPLAPNDNPGFGQAGHDSSQRTASTAAVDAYAPGLRG